ncbi:hypothetical protein NP493_836g01064 [Ridgeia piscesae]|uniref:Uncharacterized protein n=1 Tax=Ridgeia piscesae TaxID=27915 RepID=A0AAD9KP08_RIDPI|nr:hypothetical protein NP493_836g01064 [Ridgeia piscesae]
MLTVDARSFTSDQLAARGEPTIPRRPAGSVNHHAVEYFSPRRDCIENKPPLTGEYETRYRLLPAAVLRIPRVPAHTSSAAVRRRQPVCDGLPSTTTVPRPAFTHRGVRRTLSLISLDGEHRR